MDNGNIYFSGSGYPELFTTGEAGGSEKED
jgi:hypothetical protein